MVEVFEGERASGDQLGNVVVPLLQHLLHDPLRVRGRRAAVALDVGQEAPQLLGRHVGAALGVLGEVLGDVTRRLGLRDLELASEAHTHPVTPH